MYTHAAARQPAPPMASLRLPEKALFVPAYSRTMACVPESAETARRLVAEVLDAWGLGDLADSAVLCVSELVANAVQHSGARIIRVTISRPLDCRVRIAVTERGHGLPVPGHPGLDEEHGRGLILINALSDCWGHDVMRWGKRVWCELHDPGRTCARVACASSGVVRGGEGCDGV